MIKVFGLYIFLLLALLAFVATSCKSKPKPIKVGLVECNASFCLYRGNCDYNCITCNYLSWNDDEMIVGANSNIIVTCKK